MRLATVDQIKNIDDLAQKKCSLSAEILMESVGATAAFYIPSGSVVVVCGNGHNGADGFVLARHLSAQGRTVLIFLPDALLNNSNLHRLQKLRAKKAGVHITSDLAVLETCDVIVDAIFGVGFHGPVRPYFTKLITTINKQNKNIISLDVPSGLDANTGFVENFAVQATMTLTFGCAKPGFFVADGPRHVGRIKILNIGLPRRLIRQVANSHFLVSQKQVRTAFPKREDRTNKSDHGHVLILAGHPGFWGAGILASHAAFRIGAGYVTWASFEPPTQALKDIPEVLLKPIDDALFKQSFSSVVIGPGLGVSSETAKVIKKLIAQNVQSVVVDADAIATAAQFGLFPLPQQWILTPHSGELGRVLGRSAEQIDKDRFLSVDQAVKKMGGHVLLKGFRTVVSDGKKTAVVPVGNSALAKAGSGDVLSGLIGGLLAQGLTPFAAATSAAYIHGLFSDQFVHQGGHKNALLPSDIYDHLPRLLTEILKR